MVLIRRVSGIIVDGRGFLLEEPQAIEGLTPYLAMGWQRLLDSQSPAKDFEGSQIEIGRSNDWCRFIPGWVRDRGKKNKGDFCGRFEPESWHYSVLSHHFKSIFMHTVPLFVDPVTSPI